MGVRPGMDLDFAVAAGGLGEFADGPAGLALDPALTARAARTMVRYASMERQLLPRDRLQRLQLHIVMSRPDALDIPRSAMRGVHDLHRRSPDDVLTVRTYGTGPTYGPALVHNLSPYERRNRRSAACGWAQSQNVAQLG